MFVTIGSARSTLPMPLCNLKLTGNGKLVQIKPISVDIKVWHGFMDFWVYQVTGLDASEWLSEGGGECQRSRMDLFTRMHKTALDYWKFLRETGSLSPSSFAMHREGLLVEFEEYLDADNSGVSVP